MKMVSASLVQVKEWRRWFQPAMKSWIASTRSATEANVPRRMAWRVMIPKKVWTMFSQEPEVGVKCSWIRLCRGEPVPHCGMLVGAVVVQHEVQLAARVGLRDLFEEAQELLVPVPRHACRGDFQGGEQGGGAVPDVAVGGAFGQSGAHRQDRSGPVEGLDLTFLVHAEHDGVFGRVEVEPDDVADLGVQVGVGRELERLT